MLTSLKHHQTPLIIKNHRPASRHTSACRNRPLPKSSSSVNHEALPYAPSNFACKKTWCDFNGADVCGRGESLKFFSQKMATHRETIVVNWISSSSTLLKKNTPLCHAFVWVAAMKSSRVYIMIYSSLLQSPSPQVHQNEA